MNYYYYFLKQKEFIPLCETNHIRNQAPSVPAKQESNQEKLIKQLHLETSRVPPDVQLNLSAQKGIEHPHLVELSKNFGSLRRVRPLEPR
jgi:hypothetical protein